MNEGPEQYSKELNIDDCIEFTEPQPYEKVMMIVLIFRILLHPAIKESFGMTFKEAMAHCLPVNGVVKSGAVL